MLLGRLTAAISNTLCTSFNALRSSTKLFEFGGVRWTTYGQEYQPSTRRRKRKFGYLARLWSKDGRKILHRRIMKGRARLSA